MNEPNYKYKIKIKNSFFTLIRLHCNPRFIRFLLPTFLLLTLLSITCLIAGEISLHKITSGISLFVVVLLAVYGLATCPDIIGLKKRQDIFIIKNDIIYPAILNSLTPGIDTYNITYVDFEGSKTTEITLERLFLSKADAIAFINYVKNYNNKEISRIYPEWKKDIFFIEYYHQREDLVINSSLFIQSYIYEKEYEKGLNKSMADKIGEIQNKLNNIYISSQNDDTNHQI